jgi:hypothetical protein
MEFLFILFKMLFASFHMFFIFCVRGQILEPFEILKNNQKTSHIFRKFYRFADASRLWIYWGMFTGLNEYFHDIKITARTASGKEDIWYLMKDKKIGSLTIHSKRCRNHLAFRYGSYSTHFMNDFLVESLKKFYKNKNEIFIYLKIEKIDYHSLENKNIVQERLNPLKSEIIFEWFGVHNVNTGYL